MTLSTYLLLDGNCKKAMEFYHSCLGGELTLTTVGNSVMKSMMPESMHNKVLNSRLSGKNIQISGSDWLRPSEKPVQGNTVCLFLACESSAELKNAFEKLSVGANVTDPLVEQPFGWYGALNDQFGVRWMFHTEKNS